MWILIKNSNRPQCATAGEHLTGSQQIHVAQCCGQRSRCGRGLNNVEKSSLTKLTEMRRHRKWFIWYDPNRVCVCVCVHSTYFWTVISSFASVCSLPSKFFHKNYFFNNLESYFLSAHLVQMGIKFFFKVDRSISLLHQSLAWGIPGYKGDLVLSEYHTFHMVPTSMIRTNKWKLREGRFAQILYHIFEELDLSREER